MIQSDILVLKIKMPNEIDPIEPWVLTNEKSNQLSIE
jgi:hypothetical protein